MLDDPEGFDVSKIAERVDSATAAICISHIQYLTGHLLDLADLAALAHDHGAVLIVDATQSAGQVPIDVTAAGVDVLIAGSYKWLCSTFGAAVCYLSPASWTRFRPPMVGWRSTEHPYSLNARWLPLAATARRMEYSTMSYAAAIALGRAIGYIAGLSLTEVAGHNPELTSQLADGLPSAAPACSPPATRPAGRDRHRPLPRPRRRGHRRRADRRGVIVSPRVGSTRFSAHFYNSGDDVDRALATLDEVLR